MSQRGRGPEEDQGLSATNEEFLDERFYTARPWAYFRRRLIHLALTVDPTSELLSAPGENWTTCAD
jgi:hypothetical protein